MSLEEYGPFGTVVAVALALIATFSLMLVKMFGGTQKWTWLAGDKASFVATAGSRAVAVGIIAAVYLTISKSNHLWYVAAACILGLVVLVLIARFDRLRKLHVRDVPIVAADGTQAKDEKEQPLSGKIIIGTVDDMLPDAREAYFKARKEHGGLSPIQFLGGYGAAKLNDPESCWPGERLARISSQMTLLLMWILLCGVLALYIAASAIEIANRGA